MNFENKNKKLMFVTVGTGKVGKDIAHGIFYSIKNQNADSLVLIASKTSSEITFPFLKEMLQGSGRQYNIEEKLFEEVDDFEKLHNNYLSLIKSYFKKGYSPQNIVVDYTSGTKAMSAALVSAALTAEVNTITYIYGDRKEGRVQSGTERASSITPTSIFTSKILNKFLDMFNNYQFDSALSLLNDFELHPKFQKEVETLKSLSHLFSAWDKFDFKLSCSHLKEISHEQLSLFSLRKEFDKTYAPLLIKLNENSLSLHMVNDLVFNAYRRFEEGKYDDAVARLYRSIEMIGQIEFFNLFHCHTNDVILESLPDEARNYILKYKKSDQKQIKIALDDTFRILAIVNNQKGVSYLKNITQFRKHLGKRNDSILAHGKTPVSKDSFLEFYLFITELFNVGPKSKSNPDFSFPKINITF
ncbi:MAG: TIGR02710 family CRISPR-associated protein [Melioribacter sp.]|nr:TIGR02710 family CRISPR-associated protein [Melioribacter sp.]